MDDLQNNNGVDPFAGHDDPLEAQAQPPVVEAATVGATPAVDTAAVAVETPVAVAAPAVAETAAPVAAEVAAPITPDVVPAEPVAEVVEPAPAVDVALAGNVAVAGVAPAAEAAAPLVVNGAVLDSAPAAEAAAPVAEHGHGILDEVQELAEFWGGDVAIQIKRLLGKAKGLYEKGVVSAEDGKQYAAFKAKL